MNERRGLEAAKRAARVVRRTSPALWVADRVPREHYRRGAPGGMLDRGLAALVRWDMATPEERRTSIDELVEVFFTLVRAIEPATFVEAGAKDAAASIRAAGTGIPNVLAFEANPYTHRRFAEAVRAVDVEYEHLALTDEPGPVTMHVRRRDDGTAIADGQASMLVRPNHPPGYEHVTVDGLPLDDCVADRPGPIAVWVDVEGASSWVLRGAPETLGRSGVLMIEVEERVSWTGQEWLHMDVIEHLVAHGLVPVARDRQSRFQFNVVFVRRTLLGEPAVATAIGDWRSGRGGVDLRS